MFVRALLAAAPLALVGCGTEDPTMVVVDDDFPAADSGAGPSAGTTVFEVWWVTSLLPDPVAPGGEGQPERAVPGSDFAYAVLAPGWDPASSAPPKAFIAARSAAPLSASRGDTLHVHVSGATFVGDCAAGTPLSQDDADFITQRIFPGEFSGMAYDAATCTTSALLPDAGPSPGEAAAD